MNPQHLKLLDRYRYLITLALAQHGFSQRGFAANDLDAAAQLHAAPIWAKEDLVLLIVGIDQQTNAPSCIPLLAS